MLVLFAVPFPSPHPSSITSLKGTDPLRHPEDVCAEGKGVILRPHFRDMRVIFMDCLNNNAVLILPKSCCHLYAPKPLPRADILTTIVVSE